MKTACRVSAIVAATMLLAMSVHAQCSDVTLRGDYSFTVSGQILNVGPVNGVAETHFDGMGYVEQVDFVVHNGTVPPGWRPGQGTYSVNPDCTGHATITPKTGAVINLEFVVLKNGCEIRTVVSDDGYQINSIGVRACSQED